MVKWGFITLHQKSTNQYSANIIALSKNNKALCKALDKAFIKHDTKQSESTIQSIDSIVKPINNKPINKEVFSFDEFWNAYGKKVDSKKCKSKWHKLKDSDKLKIKNTIQNYVSKNSDITYRKNPLTYLNGSCWDDEIAIRPVRLSYLPDAPSIL